MTTYSEAINEMFAVVKTANDGLPEPIELRWPGVEEPNVPGNVFWGRVSTQTAIEQQDTLSTCEGAAGQRMYNSQGLIFIQLFLPKSVSTAMQTGRELAMTFRNAFRNKRTVSGVVFRNSRINELGPEQLYYRFNVISEFEFNEIL